MSHVGPVVAGASDVTEHFPPVANASLHSNPVWDTTKTSLCDGQIARGKPGHIDGQEGSKSSAIFADQ